MIVPANKFSNIKKVIGVVSGKGGVGKSLVTALSAIGASRMGYISAILDADITGPSIPKMFGLSGQKAYGTEDGLLPVETAGGIKTMSVNLILENETDPVAWRGPIISNVVTQFWNEVVWGDVDCMFVDMPPGTGDVLLTVFQSIPLDGIIIVTSPQQLVTLIVEKAVNMANQMNIPILGAVENMSYVECPDCSKKIEIFGKSRLEEISQKYGIKALARIPVLPNISDAVDSGKIEGIETDFIDGIMTAIKELL